MTTSTETASPSSVAATAKIKAFAIVFSLVFPVAYVVCEHFNFTLFTYHPATNRIELWYARPRSGEGPTMYWYGWVVLAMIGSSIAGMLATLLPERVISKIPLALLWLLPTLAFIPLAYSLMPFWTK